MLVKELIRFLQAQPQDMQVAYAKYSEWCLLQPQEIVQQTLSRPRPDGWIESRRPDKPTQTYLMFPGN